MGTLHGFVRLLFGLQIVTHAMGFSSGGFTEACSSLLPQHQGFDGVNFPPLYTDPPFEINVIAGEGDSIIVRLGSVSAGAPPFRGFMAEVRKSESELALGRFVEFGPGSAGLACNGITDSAVTQNTNVQKTFVQVKWQAQENVSSSFFLRAMFLEEFTRFWAPVDVTMTPEPTTQPSTTTITSKPSTAQPSTVQPSTVQPSTDQPSTDQPSTEQPGSTSAPETTSSKPSDNRTSGHYLAVALLIFSITINGHGFLQPPTIKIFWILQRTLSLAAEIISLILLCLWDSGCVPPIVLVSVVLSTSLIGYSWSYLDIGPSHELKKIYDCVTQVITIFHEVLLTTAIFLCLWKIEESDVWKICCDSLLLLEVMAGYTAWRFLFFLLIICVFKKTTQRIQQRNQRGNDYADNRCTKSTSLTVIFNLGNIAFTIALIVHLSFLLIC